MAENNYSTAQLCLALDRTQPTVNRWMRTYVVKYADIQAIRALAPLPPKAPKAPKAPKERTPFQYPKNPILTYLEEHYVCAALPFGALTKVGSVFGVSRERVRQIANKNGFAAYITQDPDARVIIGKTGRQICPDCGKPTGRQRYAESYVRKKRCDDCRYITIPCGSCGEPVKRQTAEFITRLSPEYRAARIAAGQPFYQGEVFCNRSCHGKYLAETVGWAKDRTENRAKVVAALSEPRTLDKLKQITGLSNSGVRNILVDIGATFTLRKQTGNPKVWSLPQPVEAI